MEHNFISRNEFNRYLSVESQFEEIVSGYGYENIDSKGEFINHTVFKTTFSDSLLFKLENTYSTINDILYRIIILIKRHNIGRFPVEFEEVFEKEIIILLSSIDEIAKNTESNGIKLLNGQRKNIILKNNNENSGFIAVGEEIFGEYELKVATILSENWTSEKAIKYIFENFNNALYELHAAVDYINNKIAAIKDCKEQVNKKPTKTLIRKIDKKEEDASLLDIQIEIMNNAKKSILTAAGKNLNYDVMLGMLK